MPYQYISFYKPYGVLSQFTGELGQRTLAEFGLPKGVYAAGRLDADSEGLLLLTDDGELVHRLLDPKFAHPRTYWVQVEGNPTDEALKKLIQGLVIQNYKTRPCQAKRLEISPKVPDRSPPIRFRKTIPTAWLEITLIEGKNRQVRKMTAAIGHPTLRLIRVVIGNLKLGTLMPGEWKKAHKEEVN